MSYKKCPRCELNYINHVEEVLCRVCSSEVGKAIRVDSDEEEYEFCSICGESIIKASEEICYQCLTEQTEDEVNNEENQKRDEWEGLLSEDKDDFFDDEEDEEDDGLMDLDDEMDLDVDESYED